MSTNQQDLTLIQQALEASSHISECADHPEHLTDAEAKARAAIAPLVRLSERATQQEARLAKRRTTTQDTADLLDSAHAALVRCRQRSEGLVGELAEANNTIRLVWEALGSPAYEDLGGLSIWEVVSGLVGELAAAQEALRQTWQALTDYADHEDEKYLMDAFAILDVARAGMPKGETP